MKIAHIVRRFTFAEWGGTESVVWNLALQQQAQGLSPEILCTAALDKVGTEIVEGITIRRYPYLYPYFPMPEKDRLALDKKGGNPFAPHMLKDLKNNHYDIVHIHAGGRIAQYVSKLCKKRSLPCIMSLHGGSCVIPEQEMALMLKPLKHKFSYGGIIDRICRARFAPESSMDMLLALSKEETVALQRRFPAVAVRTFPNGIVHRELPDDHGFRKKYGIPETATLILCISRIDYQKNQRILLDLLKQTEQTHLLLIGPITAPWYHEDILKYARELDIENRMTIIPGLAPDSIDLLQALKTAYCFILPSRHEPFGIAALEALDAGIPLIAAAVGGLKDFLKQDVNAILFEDNDVDGLCRAFAKLGQCRETLIANGKETARLFDWRTLAETLTDIYRELQQ